MGLGSGIRKKPIPDPGSRIQGSKRHRIPDPDPQHWAQESRAHFYVNSLPMIQSLSILYALARRRTNILHTQIGTDFSSTLREMSYLLCTCPPQNKYSAHTNRDGFFCDGLTSWTFTFVFLLAALWMIHCALISMPHPIFCITRLFNFFFKFKRRLLRFIAKVAIA